MKARFTAASRGVFSPSQSKSGSAIDPLVELYDPRHVQLAWAQGTATFSGDARLQAVLPADGRYTVELHDALYRAMLRTAPAGGATRKPEQDS